MTQREMNLRPLSAVKHEIVYWFINLSTPFSRVCMLLYLQDFKTTRESPRHPTRLAQNCGEMAVFREKIIIIGSFRVFTAKFCLTQNGLGVFDEGKLW